MVWHIGRTNAPSMMTISLFSELKDALIIKTEIYCMLLADVPYDHFYAYGHFRSSLFFSGLHLSPSAVPQGPFGVPCSFFLITRHDVLIKGKVLKRNC